MGFQQKLIQFLMDIFFVSLGWILTFAISYRLMMIIGDTPSHISIIFIPAGYKLLVSMILRWRSVPGLFFGSLFINHFFFPAHSVLDCVFLSAVSALSGILAIMILEYLFYKKNHILDLKLEKLTLIFLSLSYGVTNSLLHTLTFKLTGIAMVRLADPFRMFVVDVLGVLVFIAMCQLLLYVIKK